MDAIDVLRIKRDGGTLSPEQIRWVIGAYTDGTVPDEQMSALLMAVFFRGMSPDELAVWTQAMIDSGERKDLTSLGRPTADKHSTGGVGDKITLPLAPLVAARGGAGPVGGRLRGRGAAAVGPGPRPHRRHPRQARGDPGVAGRRPRGRLPAAT